MPKVVEETTIVKKLVLNHRYFILELQTHKPLQHIIAGQFVQILVPNNSTVFLRRPFSIHDITNDEHLRILIQIVGKATFSLSQLSENQTLNIIYPLGKGFHFNHLKNNALLIGGGCGVAPLLLLARQISKLGIHPDIIIGTKSVTDLIEIDEYKKYGEVYITTEDGSVGTKGYVTQHQIFNNLQKYEQIYACGPEAMMKAVSKKASEHNVPCQVSLENTMACGIGACLCCITPTIKGNLCVCTEGPVFNSNELLW
ncbi:MAG: dihydroorotate dehydrogenase electron transfer subunit [Bacteroidales bacterium]|nr:dihydroorotate dehydrogenase electron transfer subunit [Bacteroidales bacterium]